MSKLIIIDNFDSFTFNLVHFLEPHCKELIVFRNNEINYDKISVNHKILLSPGPGLPENSKELFRLIEKYQFTNNIMGVCLGFQAIGQFYGANLINLKNVRHGIQTEINILNHDCIFKGLPSHFKIGHYHSWIIDKVPNILNITAVDYENNTMAFKHSLLDVFGIQFHPESILTENGQQILKNWIKN